MTPKRASAVLSLVVFCVVCVSAKMTPEQFRRAVELANSGRYEQAEQMLLDIIAYQPDDANAHMLLAIVLMNQEKLEQAERELLSVISIEPDFATAYYLLGKVYSAQATKQSNAISAWEKFLMLENNTPRAKRVRKHLEKIR
jgi:tetratricopeptide (TPR) repeat protein